MGSVHRNVSTCKDNTERGQHTPMFPFGLEYVIKIFEW